MISVSQLYASHGWLVILDVASVAIEYVRDGLGRVLIGCLLVFFERIDWAIRRLGEWRLLDWSFR